MQSGAGWRDFTDLVARLEALQAFRNLPAFAPAAETFKRVSNILDPTVTGETVPDALRAPAEQNLLKGILRAEMEVGRGFADRNYAAVLEAVGTLHADVAALFDAVLVNDPDPGLRRPRHLLLRRVRDMVGQIADFSAFQAA